MNQRNSFIIGIAARYNITRIDKMIPYAEENSKWALKYIVKLSGDKSINEVIKELEGYNFIRSAYKNYSSVQF